LINIGEEPRARRYARLAALTRDGEPLNRMVGIIGEQTFELDEIDLPPNVECKVVFARNRIALGKSERLTERAREAAQSGNPEDALVDFREASKIDPHNPHPLYLQGLALLNLGRFHQAVEVYEQTEQLAPGWFDVRSD